ncbi:MAG TPA: hypothetical protein VFQ61_16430 [Polyangiaceae bacterium]|nr:hypothetical protein [Polyangiaceae bacterium]
MRHTILGFSMTLGAALAGSISGCSSETGSSSTGADVASDEAALSAAQGSLASAKEQAKACFDTFRSCREASGANVQACRDALKACLPAEAPKPPHCGAPSGQRGDKSGGDDAAAGSSGDEHEGGHGRACDRPPVDGGKVKACGARAGTAVDQGTSVDSAKATHADCMNKAFGDVFKKICERASSACADSKAPADVCARITEECASLPATP